MDQKIIKEFVALIGKLQDKSKLKEGLDALTGTYPKLDIVHALREFLKDDKNIPQGDALVRLLNLIPLAEFRNEKILKHLDGAKGLEAPGTKWGVQASYPTLSKILGKMIG